MINEKVIRNEEKAIFNLRNIYKKYGYVSYKMNKFEEYELYIRNKDFLVSDRIITFNDTNGKLLALKPDVTLSIIKGCEDIPGYKNKVYYNENVYRVSPTTHRYKEIMQTGIECIGDLDILDIFETIKLACESLASISENFALDISSLGILSTIVDNICIDETFKASVLKYISEKNTHDLKRLCNQYKVSEESLNTLVQIAGIYGKRSKVISVLESIKDISNLSEIKELSSLLDTLPYEDKIFFDFSITSNMNYYNGFIFKGYIDGVFEAVLSGGQYDNMMNKMGKSSKAIGFALYLDDLEQIGKEDNPYDVDTIVLYDDKTDKKKVIDKVNSLLVLGKTVSTQKTKPEKIRYREITDIREDIKND